MRWPARLKKASDRLAVTVTKSVGSMWCVYGFTLWCFVPMVYRPSAGFVSYVSGGISFVALPLIMVGQSLLNRKAERRAEEDHKRIMQTLNEIRDLERKIKVILTHHYPDQS